MIKKLSQRFDELAEEAEKIEATKGVNTSGFTQVDIELFDKWKVNVKSLIIKSCGKDSVHIKDFENAEQRISMSTSYSDFKRAKPVFIAAKEDFQGGFLSSVKSLVQAEVFDSELEQASELLESGYKAPAAVIAGVVLETALRDICSENSIPHAKLDKMNADLAKAGVYNKLQQKKITTLADIRNNAAHGHWEEFNNDDVKEMIRDVERFLLVHLV